MQARGFAPAPGASKKEGSMRGEEEREEEKRGEGESKSSFEC